MKRKLALFMATMMTLSLLPMNVFANTKGTLYKSVGSVPEDTVMLETSVYDKGLIKTSGHDDIDYYVGGSDLVLEVSDVVTAGEQFRVSITNADFFFRGDMAPTIQSSINSTSVSALRHSLNAGGYGSSDYVVRSYASSLASADANIQLAVDTRKWGSTAAYTAGYRSTYDSTKGYWYYNTSDLSGTYYRYPGSIESTKREGIPYKLDIDAYSDKTAVITVLPYANEDNTATVEKSFNYNDSTPNAPTTASANGWELRIPLVSLTSDGTDIKVRVESNTAGITSGTWLFGLTSGNATKTEVTDPQTARDDFEVLDDLLISETRLGSIRSGQVYIKLPSGFEWANIDNAQVGVSSGLSWGNTQDRLRRGSTTGYYSGYSSSLNVPTGSETESTYNGTPISTASGNTVSSTGTSEYWEPSSVSGVVGFGNVYGGTTTSTVTYREYVTTGAITQSAWVSVTDLTAVKTSFTSFSDSEAVNWIISGGKSNTGDGAGATITGTVTDSNSTTHDIYSNTSAYSWLTSGSTKTNTGGLDAWDYALNYKNPGTTSEDRSILVLSLNGINRSENVLGSVYIRNLEFYAEENAAYGPVNAEISNVDSNIEVVTDQTFLAGTRVDWTISLKALGTIPELVNGRYDAEEPWSASDVHKTARVQFKENTVAAWWAQRQTVFSLPEGVKFRKVQITKVEEMDGDTTSSTNYENKLKSDSYTSSYYGYAVGSGVYVNDAEKHGYVTVDGNQFILNNLKVNDKEKATIEFDAWVSIESGFQGDVTLSVSGSAIPEQPGTVPAVVIAKQISPVSISTKITDVKIGYQYVATATIEITETKAGILEKGKDVRVSVTDLVSTDLYFSSDTKVAVKNAGETGALKIKDVQNVAAGSSTVYGLAVNGGTIKFVVDLASSKASTIVISDVAVKVDRTVPETNKYPYKVVVWGKAIANNYQYINDSEHYRYPRTTTTATGTNYAKDLFGTAGIQADYIRIVTSANDKPNVLYAEVRVTIGEKYYTVNGKQSDMDAAAYISTASNSTMVPLRFVSNALGITSEGVIWDDTNRTVTIIAPDGKIAQFKIGDSTMTINGTPITMMSPDGLPVMAEIVGDRSYVPFRALGDAFGIPVEWEEDTQSAVYNKGAATGTTEATATEAATTESTR